MLEGKNLDWDTVMDGLCYFNSNLKVKVFIFQAGFNTSKQILQTWKGNADDTSLILAGWTEFILSIKTLMEYRDTSGHSMKATNLKSLCKELCVTIHFTKSVKFQFNKSSHHINQQTQNTDFKYSNDSPQTPLFGLFNHRVSFTI